MKIEYISLKNFKEVLGQDMEYYNWSKISLFYFLSEDFIDRYQHLIDFKMLSWNQYISEEVFTKYSNRIDWKAVSHYINISDSFIFKHYDKVCFSTIDFIRELNSKSPYACQDYVYKKGLRYYQR